MPSPSAEVIRPLRRVEYEKLVNLGVFENERVELIDGVILQMSPINEPHNWALQVLTEKFVLAMRGRAWVRIQMSFAAAEYSQPEPDLALTPRDSDRAERPSEAYLIVEVADSSVAFDRGKKRKLYARCGMREYWVVNIPKRRVEVYSEPSGEAYTVTKIYKPGQSIRVGAFDDVVVAVSDVLGEREP